MVLIREPSARSIRSHRSSRADSLAKSIDGPSSPPSTRDSISGPPKEPLAMSPGAKGCHLTGAEIQAGKEAFDRSRGIGRRDPLKLKQVLEGLGIKIPFEIDLEALLAAHVPASTMFDREHGLEFEEFLTIMNVLKSIYLKWATDKDIDLVDAFVAMGGCLDRSGEVLVETLKTTFTDFHLNIDIDKLVSEVDTNNDGTVDYDEFSYLLCKEDNPVSNDMFEMVSGGQPSISAKLLKAKSMMIAKSMRVPYHVVEATIDDMAENCGDCIDARVYTDFVLKPLQQFQITETQEDLGEFCQSPTSDFALSPLQSFSRIDTNQDGGGPGSLTRTMSRGQTSQRSFLDGFPSFNELRSSVRDLRKVVQEVKSKARSAKEITANCCARNQAPVIVVPGDRRNDLKLHKVPGSGPSDYFPESSFGMRPSFMKKKKPTESEDEAGKSRQPTYLRPTSNFLNKSKPDPLYGSPPCTPKPNTNASIKSSLAKSPAPESEMANPNDLVAHPCRVVDSLFTHIPLPLSPVGQLSHPDTLGAQTVTGKNSKRHPLRRHRTQSFPLPSCLEGKNAKEWFLGDNDLPAQSTTDADISTLRSDAGQKILPTPTNNPDDTLLQNVLAQNEALKGVLKNHRKKGIKKAPKKKSGQPSQNGIEGCLPIRKKRIRRLQPPSSYVASMSNTTVKAQK